jgi:hypothetical protein
MELLTVELPECYGHLVELRRLASVEPRDDVFQFLLMKVFLVEFKS